MDEMTDNAKFNTFANFRKENFKRERRAIKGNMLRI
jgi:hypothetical protein